MKIKVIQLPFPLSQFPQLCKLGFYLIRVHQFKRSSLPPSRVAMPKNKKNATKSAVESSVSAAGAAADVEVQEQKKQHPTKRTRDEIDEIFASKKKQSKKSDNQKPTSKKPAKESDHDKMMTKKNNTGKRNTSKNGSRRENGGSDPPAAATGGAGRRLRKKTGDGLAIYTEGELGIGRADAGGTPLCPFDCDCCF